MNKILGIDGGGIKGVFPASFLAQIEQSVGRNVADFFDLIVGTSTGGIIALGLGMGFSARAMLAFYMELGPSVFRGSTGLIGIPEMVAGGEVSQRATQGGPGREVRPASAWREHEATDDSVG